jgi:hypothetical protein
VDHTQLLINHVLSAASVQNINYFSSNQDSSLHFAILKYIKDGACVRDALIAILDRSQSHANRDAHAEHCAVCHLLHHVSRGDYAILQAWSKRHKIGVCMYSSQHAAGREVRNWLRYAEGREDEILLRNFVRHCRPDMPADSYSLLSKPDDLPLTFWFFLLEPESVQNFLLMLTTDEIKKCISSNPNHAALANIVTNGNSGALIAHANAYLMRLAVSHVMGKEAWQLETVKRVNFRSAL